jgi:hypothetical protein
MRHEDAAAAAAAVDETHSILHDVTQDNMRRIALHQTITYTEG